MAMDTNFEILELQRNVSAYQLTKGNLGTFHTECHHLLTVTFERFGPLANITLDGQCLTFQDKPISVFNEDFVFHAGLALDFGDGCHDYLQQNTLMSAR